MDFELTNKLEVDQIRYIARKFFDRYKNPNTDLIDNQYAEYFIKDVYK